MIKSIIWAISLLAGFPLFVIYDLHAQASWIVITYAGLYGLLLIVFTWFASARRRVLGLVALSVLTYSFVTSFGEFGLFQYVQAASYLALTVLVILVIESIHQNVPLLRHSSGGALGWARTLGAALLTWIWIPIFLVPLSLWVSHQFFTWLDQQFYAQTPISKYCALPKREAFDCTNVPNVKEAKRRSVGIYQQLNTAMDDAFYSRQTRVLDRIQGEDTSQAINIISRYQLRPASIFAFQGKDVKKVVELEGKIFNYQAASKKLNEELAQLKVQLLAITPFGNSSKRKKLSQSIKRYKNSIAALKRDVELFQKERKQLQRSLQPHERQIFDALNASTVTVAPVKPGSLLPWEIEAKLALNAAIAIRDMRRSTETQLRRIANFKAPSLQLLFPRWNLLCEFQTRNGDDVLSETLPCDVFDGAFSRRQTFDLPTNVEKTLLAHTRPHRHGLERRFGESAADIRSGKKSLEDVADEFSDELFQPIDFDIPSCRFWQLRCQAERWVKEPISALVNSGIDFAKNQFEQGAAQAIKQGNQNSEVGLVKLRAQALRTLDRLEQSTIQRTARTIEWSQMSVKLILLLGFVQVILRSFLSILGAKLFDQQHGLTADAIPATGTALSAQPFNGQTSFGNQVTIPVAFHVPMVSKTPLDNQAFERRLIPQQPGVALLARLRWGWFSQLCQGSHEQGGQPMAIRSKEGRELIEWHLAPEDELVIDFKRLVAMSANVKLRSRISLRLSTLPTGKSIFHCAYCESGEGILIMEAEGHAVTLAQDSTTPIERIVAWSTNTLFQTSRSSSSAVYKDGYNLRPISVSQPNNVVADSAREVATPLWLWTKRFVRMLMPI